MLHLPLVFHCLFLSLGYCLTECSNVLLFFCLIRF